MMDRMAYARTDLQITARYLPAHRFFLHIREDRVLYERRVRETVEGIAAAYGAEAEITWIDSAPARLWEM